MAISMPPLDAILASMYVFIVAIIYYRRRRVTNYSLLVVVEQPGMYRARDGDVRLASQAPRTWREISAQLRHRRRRDSSK